MPVFFDTEQLVTAIYKRGRPGMHLAGEEPTPTAPYIYGRDYFNFSDDPSLGNVSDRIRAQFTNQASGMVNLGVATNASILVVGDAYGYLMEALISVGITDVWGIEPGAWWWDPANDSEWAAGMKARTAQDWIGSGTERNSLNALGVSGQARFTFVVDADAAPCQSDAELPAFIAGLEARLQGNVKGRIIHLVSASLVTGVGGDSTQNWKTLEDWQAVAPDHTWLDRRSL